MGLQKLDDVITALEQELARLERIVGSGRRCHRKLNKNRRNMEQGMNEQAMLQAAEIIRQADSILITAGAGMGVDSGLPDFRGDQGLWKAYPALGRARLGFTDIANPRSFRDNPRLAWGFYGHRYNLYRQTVPHAGFSLLQRIADTKEQGAFVYTSNVDGQFQKSGFANTRVVECHGSIFHLQCTENCTEHIWPAHDLELDVDDAACELRSDLPVCPECGALARPNILMFDDWSWQSSRTDMQYEWLRMWRNRLKCPVVIEIGAGTAVPTVRRKGEGFRAPLIRINPRDTGMARNGLINLEAGALEGLQALGTMLGV